MLAGVSGLRKQNPDKQNSVSLKQANYISGMKNILVRFLKSIGLYDVLLSRKRKLNQLAFEKQEQANLGKRKSFYSRFLAKDDLVFDVGANVGNRVQIFLELQCRVIAVEPQQECINELRKRFGTGITIVEKGLGEKEEEKTMYIADASTISSFSEEWINSVKESRFSRHEWNKTMNIQLTTLDKLVAQYGLPEFCKIDVEGFELEVLKGLHQPIPCLSLEYTVPEQTNKLLECIGYCNRLSPAYQYNYAAGEEMKYELAEFCSYAEFVKVIATKEFQSTGFGDIYVKMP
jgi:FkbM family methyltransferase